MLRDRRPRGLHILTAVVIRVDTAPRPPAATQICARTPLRHLARQFVMTEAPANSAHTLLVTGLGGFVGGHVRAALAQSRVPTWRLLELPAGFDLTDRVSTRQAVATLKPDAVLHLAGQSAVPSSYTDPETTFTVNVLGTLHLLEALDAGGFRGRLLYVGSGDVYGFVAPEELPVDEGRLPRPRNPYAVSKLAAEALCWQWHINTGMDIVLARPFNHIGAGQSDQFAIADFARQIAAIKAGRQPPRIATGDLDATRDFTDVRDVVEAYLLLLERGVAGDIYNVCSGVERTIRSMLLRLVELAGVEPEIVVDTARIRPSEQRRMRGDPTRLRRTTGWTPRIALDDSLRSALAFWEGKN